MRFVLVNQYYPPDRAPTGRALHDVARVLVERGHDVRVLCSTRSYEDGERFASRVLDGVRVDRVPALGLGRESAGRRIADYASFGLLLAPRLLAGPRSDLALALTTPPFLGAAVAAVCRLRGLRHAHWVMDLYPDALFAHGLATGARSSSFFRRLARGQWRDACLVLCLGDRVAARAAPYLAPDVPLEVVPLWGEGAKEREPDAATLQAVRAERGWRQGELVFLASGNLGLAHRFREFLEAAAHLGASGPLWVFAGGGGRRAEIEDFAANHPCSRIRLLPLLAQSHAGNALLAADVHLASLDPRWLGVSVPSKVPAAFSLGRPVLFLGPPESESARAIEESGGGWVVSPGDVQGVLAAVAAAGDPQERLRRGRAARSYARDHFDPGRNSARVADLLEKAGGLSRG